MAHLIGTTHVDRFTLLDSSGDPILGETFTADQVRDPQDDLFAWEATELGNGLYEVRFEIDYAGVYYLRLVTVTTVPFQVHEVLLHSDDYEAGDTAKHYFTVRDDDGNYYGGAAISVVDSYGPDGLLFVPLIDDLANGLYRVTWEVPSAGVYTLRLLADLSPLGDDNQLFEFESRVLPSAQDAESPFAPVLGPTLEDLIREVALLCRDYARTTASEDSTDGTTWKDDLNFAARSPKSFKGASLFVLTAAGSENIGREVRVRDSVEGAVTLTPSLPSTVRRGDRGYLTNLESAGFTREDYKDQINARIDGLFPNALRPAVWTFDAPFDPAYPYLSPPVEFTHLSSVGYPRGPGRRWRDSSPSTGSTTSMPGGTGMGRSTASCCRGATSTRWRGCP